VGVWAGRLISANLVAILVGKFMGQRLPQRSLKYITAIIFVASGIIALIAAGRQR
jgi:putative Ca2+/H+ antiporter (TMEM165/GDT1 family)